MYLKASDIKFTVYTNGTVSYKNGTPDKVTMVDDYVKTQVIFDKRWNDNDDNDKIRPNSIKVYLYADGKLVNSMITSKENNYKGSFTNLDKFANEKQIVYTISEGAIEGYTNKITSGKVNTFTITNTHEVEKIKLSGEKVWVDGNNQDGIRPSEITITVYKDGKAYQSTTASQSTNWKYEFNLPKYENGKLITYTVKETPVNGYTSKIQFTTSAYNTKITNTHIPEVVDIKFTKTWDDANNQDGIRPESITVTLYADGVATDNIIVANKSDNYSGTFKDLPKYKNGKVIKYTIQEEEITGYSTLITGNATDGFKILNKHESELIDISGEKFWDDKNNQDGERPESVTIFLYGNGERVKIDSVSAETNWKYEFKNLPKYENGEEIIYTVDEYPVSKYTKSINEFNITNSYTPKVTSVQFEKIWNDDSNRDGIRPEEITVKLYANGEDTGKSIVAKKSENYLGQFTNLDKFADGKEIVYTIKEVAIDNYTSEVTGSYADGFVITNTHTPETINISGTKSWVDNDNQDGIRPEEVTINLYANGEFIDSIATSSEYEFKNLPKYENGEKIIYTVDEELVEGYEKSINKFNITNMHKPEELSISVTKIWNDMDNNDGFRPSSVKINLLANGKVIKDVELNNDNNWTYEFTNLPKFENGIEIDYSIKEETVDKYETTIIETSDNEYVVTNTHTPERVEIKSEKIWNDANNQDGMRPDAITIELLADGQVVDEISAVKDNNYSIKFDNLYKYKDGKEIKYSLNEKTVENYTTKINGMTITNTHIPEKVSVKFNKVWNDNNNRDGVRPETITVWLYANGTKSTSMTVSNETNFFGEFIDLDKYQNGEEIEYTISEDAVDKYTTSISGNMTDGYTITNTHIPERISLSGEKIWDDNNDQDGIRPKTVKITLYSNGKAVDERIVQEEFNYSYTFDNLYKYENGKEIKYTVDELEVPKNYKKTVENLNVINYHKPAETEVTVTKIWDDDDNRDGIRPNEVTVTLYADETAVKSAKVVDTYTFKNLPKYRDHGIEIVYTVKEETITGYTDKIVGDMKEGFTITNTHKPETVDIEGVKTWVDNDNQDSIRPQTITIKLLANNKVIKEVTVDNNKYSFKSLPKYENGKEIVYTIDEADVTGYSKQINTYNVTNTHVPEVTSIAVEKIWNDANNQDGIRPETLEVSLLADGNVVKSVELSSDNNWTYEFTNLPKYNKGQLIAYVVTEEAVENYTSEVKVENNTYVFTNSYTPGVTNVTATKVWNDVNDADGIRPKEVTIELLADSVVIDEKVITDNNLTVIFNELPLKTNGKEIVYTVREKVVPEEYTAEISGDRTTGFIITNSHKPIPKDVTISKIDATTCEELPGATLQVFLGEKLIKEWISTDTPHVITLEPGEYKLVEITAPEGYNVAEEITFTVDERGLVGSDKVVMEDAPKTYVDVKISKVSATTSDKELPGAELIITDSEGNEIERWISGDTIHEVTLEPGDYILTEVRAPKGYKVAESIPFTVNEEGLVGSDKVVMIDEEITNIVKISKVDATTSKELPGAKLVVINKDTNEVVAEHISTTTPWEIELKSGTYILREITAPNGYEVAEDITFVVDDNGLVGSEKVTMEDKPIPVTTIDVTIKVHKISANTKLPLKNAEITLFNEDGTIAKDINGNNCVGLTDENGNIIFKLNCKPGTKFYAQETKAPVGYHINPSKFEIIANADTNNEANINIEINDSLISVPGTPTKSTPYTGDTTNIFIPLITLIMSILSIIALRRRYNR